MKTAKIAYLAAVTVVLANFPPLANAQQFRFTQLQVSPSTNSKASSSSSKTSKSTYSSPTKKTVLTTTRPTYPIKSYKKPTVTINTRPSTAKKPSVTKTPATPKLTFPTKPSRPVYTPSRPSYPPVIAKRPSSPSKPAVTIPSRTRPTPSNSGKIASANTVPDIRKMISILQGNKVSTKTPTTSSKYKAPPTSSKKPTNPRPTIQHTTPIMDRIVRVNPSALPKGMGTSTYMKKGKHPAYGSEDKKPGASGGATLYMKKGRHHAEGSPAPGSPVVVRIKDGRPQAESDSSHHNNDNGYAQNLSNNNYPGSSHDYSPHNEPSYSGGAHSAGPSIAYKVDSTSQLSTSSVKFRKGSTELADAGSYNYLQNLAAALLDPSLAEDRFVIEGHASSDGSDTSNLILSQKRANAIFDFMLAQGVRSERLLSIGHGEYHARYASHEPDYLRAQDRQVMVFKLAE